VRDAKNLRAYTHASIGRVQFKKRGCSEHREVESKHLLTVGSSPDEPLALPAPAVELGTISRRRRSDDEDRGSAAVPLSGSDGPMKPVSPAATRLNAAAGRTWGGGDAAQEEWAVADPRRRHRCRGGSVQERTADVVRERAEGRWWWQRKVATPIMAVAAME